MIGDLFIGNYKVDLSKAVPFPISYSISDFKNPEKRKRSRSKTVDLPGTQRNKQIFASAFSLTLAPDNPFTSVVDFDPAARTPARYYKGGLLVFDGLVKLNKVVIENDHYMFNITLFSNVVNIIKELDKIAISELDWTEYTHQLTLDNILKSWDTSIMIGADPDGTGGTLTPNFSGAAQPGFANGYPDGFGYVYPIIEYGYDRPDATTFKANDLLPLVYVREVLTKMFAEHDIILVSDLLDTSLFKRFVVGITPGDKVSLTPAEIADREVDTTTDLDVDEVVDFTQVISSAPTPGNPTAAYNFFYRYEKVFYRPLLKDLPESVVTVVTDNLGALNTDTGTITVQRTGQYKLSLSGTMQARIQFEDTLPSGATFNVFSYTGAPAFPANQGQRKVGITIYRNNSPVLVTDTQINNIPQGGSSNTNYIAVPLDVDTILDLQAGDIIDVTYILLLTCYVQVQFPNGGGTPTQPPPPEVTVQINSDVSTTDFNLESIEGELDDGDPVLLSRFVPSMKCGQFFKGIVTAFNLYVDDPDVAAGTMRLEPLIDYYLPNSQAIDWTDKVDRNKRFEILPASTIEGQTYWFKFKDADDLENTLYFQRWGIGYGNRQYEVPNTFVTGDRIFELPFEQSVPVALGGTSMIAPRIVNEDGEPYSGAPRIYCYNGLVTLTAPDELTVTKISTPLVDPIVQSTYPNVNHQDSLTAPTFDFNWSPPRDFWEGWTGGLTNNNLWTYHSQFIFELTQSASAIVRCYVMLDPNDIYLLNFARLVKINNTLFRLNEVKDWDDSQYSSTQIELLKVITDG